MISNFQAIINQLPERMKPGSQMVHDAGSPGNTMSIDFHYYSGINFASPLLYIYTLTPPSVTQIQSWPAPTQSGTVTTYFRYVLSMLATPIEGSWLTSNMAYIAATYVQVDHAGNRKLVSDYYLHNWSMNLSVSNDVFLLSEVYPGNSTRYVFRTEIEWWADLLQLVN